MYSQTMVACVEGYHRSLVSLATMLKHVDSCHLAAPPLRCEDACDPTKRWQQQQHEKCSFQPKSCSRCRTVELRRRPWNRCGSAHRDHRGPSFRADAIAAGETLLVETVDGVNPETEVPIEGESDDALEKGAVGGETLDALRGGERVP